MVNETTEYYNNQTDRLINGNDTIHSANNKNSANRDIEELDKINSIKSEEGKEIVARYTKDGFPIERVKFEGFDDIDSIRTDTSPLNGDRPLPPIPDGGWGWVVVFSAFLVSACLDGLAFSFGLLHEEFTSYFNTSQSKTALIGSIFMATPLLVGPIMSALVDRYGCRITTMIAGFLSTVCFLLASISNSVEMLCLTLGFLCGLAKGVLCVTPIVSVAFWFDKRRNFALSLAACGIGFGTLLYSPLTHYLLEEYGWRSTMIILAGTVLNMCVCGAVMRNPEYLEIKQKRERELSRQSSKRSSSAGSVSSKSIGGDNVFLRAEELKSLLKSGKSPDYILATLTTNIAEAEQLEATTQMNAKQSCKGMFSTIYLPTFVQRNEKVPQEVIEKLMENKRLYNIILHNYPEIITRRKSEVNHHIKVPPSEAVEEPVKQPVEIKFTNRDIQELKDGQKSETDNLEIQILVKQEKKDKTKCSTQDIRDHSKDNKEIKDGRRNSHKKEEDKDTKHQCKEIKPGEINQQSGWMRRISIDHHYFRDMPLYRNTIMHRSAMLSIPRYKLRASSLPDMYRNSEWSIASSVEMTTCDRTLEFLKTMFNFRMFTEFHFMMFNVSTFILSIWFIVPYFYLNSFMNDRGTQGGETMISIIGIASTIGIVALGWTGDQPWINVVKAYAICLIICGFSVAAYPFCITNYWAISVVSAIFGLSFASSYAYFPAILMELMPMDHFTVAYGLTLLVFGIGHLAGPPIGGLCYDITGSWDLTFYVGGIWIVISGICVGVIAYTKDVRMCGTAPLLKEADDAEKSKAINV